MIAPRAAKGNRSERGDHVEHVHVETVNFRTPRPYLTEYRTRGGTRRRREGDAWLLLVAGKGSVRTDVPELHPDHGRGPRSMQTLHHQGAPADGQASGRCRNIRNTSVESAAETMRLKPLRVVVSCRWTTSCEAGAR